MQCTEIRAQMEKQGSETPTPEVHDHVQQCGSCRDYAKDLRLQALLRSLPLKEAEEGFADRVLAAARQGNYPQSSGDRRWLAAAAAVMVAVLMVMNWHSPRTVEQTGDLAVADHARISLEPLELLLNSDVELDYVTLTVDLPENIRLEGYANQTRLQWTSKLDAGANKLVLPVQLRDDILPDMVHDSISGAEIIVQVEHQGRRKEFRVPLRGLRQSGAPRSSVYMG